MKYRVTLTVETSYDIEANSKEEAKSEALSSQRSGYPGEMCFPTIIEVVELKK